MTVLLSSELQEFNVMQCNVWINICADIFHFTVLVCYRTSWCCFM